MTALGFANKYWLQERGVELMITHGVLDGYKDCHGRFWVREGAPCPDMNRAIFHMPTFAPKWWVAHDRVALVELGPDDP